MKAPPPPVKNGDCNEGGMSKICTHTVGFLHIVLNKKCAHWRCPIPRGDQENIELFAYCDCNTSRMDRWFVQDCSSFLSSYFLQLPSRCPSLQCVTFSTITKRRGMITKIIVKNVNKIYNRNNNIRKVYHSMITELIT
jgi:hypothetical protein